MPTSGEAKLVKKKPLGTIKARSTSSSNVKPKKSATTSRLPVARKSSVNRGKENTEPFQNKKVKAKPAPDFSKLHNKWNKQFEKGKAVSKKINTKAKPFVLTENSSIKPRTQSNINNEEENSEIENEFEIDPSALQGILNNTGIEVEEKNKPQNNAAATQQSAQNTIFGYSTKRTSIYYMGSREDAKSKAVLQEHQSSSSNLMSAGRKTIDADKCKAVLLNQDKNDDDEISFKPDAMALESILNNKGIDNRPLSRHTMASTRTMPLSKRQSLFDEKQSKRTSIYYNGTRPITDSSRQSLIGKSSTKGIGTLGSRGIRRMTSVGQPTGNPYNVGSTIVGITGTAVNDGNDDDEISFKPDAMALESILNNKGIDNRSLSRHTMASTRTMPLSKRQSLFDDKRTSIYYIGKKTSKTLIEPGRPSLLASSKSNYTKPSSKPLPAASNLQYALGSTVVGFQDATPLKDGKDSDESTFAKPLLPEQRKETKQIETKPTISALMTPSRAHYHTTNQQQQDKDNEAKSFLYSTLMTPSRGQLDTRYQAPTSTKKHVTWSEILTPHRDQQPVVNTINKGGSILKKTLSQGRKAEKPCSPVLRTPPDDVTLNVHNSPTLDSLPIAMKLFSNDNTTTDVCLEKLQLDEFEKQAIKDLQLLDLEEDPFAQPSGNIETREMKNKIMTTPSIDISGCVPLTSPPDIVCTPSALGTPFKVPSGSQGNDPPMNQWIAATPENHMRVTLREQTPSNSHQILSKPQHNHFKKPQRFDTPGLIAPVPLTTPIRTPSVVNADVAFGLLSSIKRNTSRKPTTATIHKCLSLGETLVSSTPGINVTSVSSGTGPINPPLINGSTNWNIHKGNDASHVVSKSNHDNNLKKEVTLNLTLEEPQRSEVFQKYQSQVTQAPTHHIVLNKQNGSFVSTSRKRNYLSEREVDESLSLRSSLKPKLKRVDCISPYGSVTELKPREPRASLKDISLPATSLTHQALLDAEITLYSCLGKRIQNTCSRSLDNPLSMLFRDGDSQHFVPLCLCTETINCPVHPNIRR